MIGILLSSWLFVVASVFQIGGINCQTSSWIQLGNDIDGEFAMQYFGRSMAMSVDGTMIAVSGRGTVEDDFTGVVRVLKYDASIQQWTQIGSKLAGVLRHSDFGSSVSMSADGTMIAVGDRNNLETFVFKLTINPVSGSEWIQVGSKIKGSYNELFGQEVCLSGNGLILAVGAINFNDAMGKVQTFKLLNSSWVQIGSNIVGEAARDFFGGSIAMSYDGTIMAIGAIGNDASSREDAGHVRVYQMDLISLQWVQIGREIDGTQVGQHFGSAVAMSIDGTVLAVGADSTRSGNTRGVGSVMAYKLTIAGTRKQWLPLGPAVFGRNSYDAFGFSVSISADGSMIAAGAINNDGNGTNSGHVRVHKYNESSTQWIQIGSDLVGEAMGDRSGASAFLSGDGTILSIGAYNNKNNNTESSGHVRVYTLNTSTAPTAPIAAPTKAPTSSVCEVTWNLYNSRPDAFVATLSNGTTIGNPPPCNRTNIEAVFHCGGKTIFNNVTTVLELYSGTTLIHRRVENYTKYFLFGNNGTNIYNGRIVPGTYQVLAIQDGITSPKSTFTLQGTCVL